MLLLFSVLIPSLLSYECDWNGDCGDGDGGILDIERQSYCSRLHSWDMMVYILTVLLSSLNQYVCFSFFLSGKKQEALAGTFKKRITIECHN